MIGILRVPLLQPFAQRSHHVGSLAFAQLNARPVTGEVGAVGQQVEQLGDRLAVHLDVRHERAPLVGDAVHAAELVVAAGVTHIVLHVADDDVLPVGHVHGAVAADFEIRRAEVAIFGRLDEVLGFRAAHVAVFIGLHRVLLDAEEADGVEDEEIALIFLGKVWAGNHAVGGHGAHRLAQQLLHAETAAAVWAHLISAAAGAIGSEVVAPVVEADAMRVGAVVGMEGVLEGARVEPVHGAVAVLLILLPGRLHVAHVEHAALIVKVTAGAVHKGVCTVVGVGTVQAVEEALAHVGHVIAVSVLEKQDIRYAGHDHAAVPELKPGRVVHLGKSDGLVGFAVAVFVREDEQTIIHLLERLPLRVGGPNSSPEASLGVHRHLHGVCHFRKHLLTGKYVYLQAFS